MTSTASIRQACANAREDAAARAQTAATKLAAARGWVLERTPYVRRRARWLRLRALSTLGAATRAARQRARSALAGRRREELATYAVAAVAACTVCVAALYVGALAFLSTRAADRAQVHARDGDHPGVIRELDDALGYWPGQADLLEQRGRSRWATGALGAADADFSAALVEAPHAMQLWYDRANVRLELGRHAAAIEDYTQVLALAPDTVEAHLGRARALLATGAAAEAVADCDQALLLGSYLEVELLVLRAQAHQALGDVGAALADASRVCVLRPDHQEARRLLDALRSLE